MSKEFYFKFITGDWLKDHNLSLCSPATRGIWIDLLCRLHDARIYKVTGTPEKLAQLCRCNAAEMHASLSELAETGAADVHERDGAYTVICRRLQKQMELSETRSKAASKTRAKCEQNPNYDYNSVKLRIGNLFRRRPDTAWSEKEEAAFAALRVDEEELSMVEKYYTKDLPKDRDYRRRDLLTLLNNWHGEVDRSRAQLNGSKPHAKLVDTRPQPPGWIAWLKRQYPEAKQKNYWLVPESVQTEFTESLAGRAA